MRTTSFTNSRKFKYGSVATAFTIAFIAIVVIFNIIFSALASRYMWYVDMTEEQIFTLSEEAHQLMSDVTADVNLYFASEPDELMNGVNSSYLRYIYTTALQLEEAFPNVHVQCESVLKNPEFFRGFYNTAASDIDTTSVVVESNGEVRVLAATAFFSYDDPTDLSTVWAYNGEKKMISTILQVTAAETPKVTFTTQHGESNGDAAALGELFEDNGFEVTTIDLAREEIDDDCRVLVIFNPIYDFIGAEAESPSGNEIEKIDRFLDEYNFLMVFLDSEYVNDLTNLNEFLEEWGISYVGSTTVRDTENAVSVDGYSLIAQYQKDSFGASLYSDLNKLATAPKTIIRKAAPINILWDTNQSVANTRNVSAVLKSYDTSEAMKNGLAGETGSYNLVTLSRDYTIVNSEYYYSYVMAFGSPTFASASYIDSNAYANEDILSAAMKAIGRERVLANLNRKPFDDSQITVTTADANRWTLAMTLAIPAVFALCGLIVITRRKHS